MGDARFSSEMRRRLFIGEGIVWGYQGVVTQRGWMVMSNGVERVYPARSIGIGTAVNNNSD